MLSYLCQTSATNVPHTVSPPPTAGWEIYLCDDSSSCECHRGDLGSRCRRGDVQAGTSPRIVQQPSPG